MSEDDEATTICKRSFLINNKRINSISNSNSSEDDSDCFQHCEYSLKNHNALCAITDKKLNEILSVDAFLNDIPYDITNEEIQSQIAVVKGQSISVYVKREPYTKFKIVIPETHTTVHDLKKAIKRNYELNQKRLANREQRTDNINSCGSGCSGTSKSTKQHKSKRSKEHHHHHHHHSHHRKNPHQELSEKSGRSHSSTAKNHAGQQLTRISWQYIWRTYYLEYDGEPLTDDKQLLSHYGVRNKSNLRFVKKIKHIRRQIKKK